MEKIWYALKTAPRAEKKVEKRLIESGVEAFLPLITTVKQWSDRKKKVISPLINSYVFVSMDEKLLYETYDIVGVQNVLKYLQKPAVIKDYEINNLRILMDNSDKINTISELKLGKGKEIEINSGPFIGLKATIIDYKGKQRVVVSLEALNDIIEVDMSIEDISYTDETIAN
ncbi:MAG: UpxY family transcription antiterminator [Flavobacteriaceae bacterium]|nr:UpxY family transcription antiterminator [Flavobacteriaceae bacterium]